MAPLTPIALYDPQVLTPLVDLRAPEDTIYDLGDFCPIVEVKKRRVRLNIRSGNLHRIGQFRAENALTPISVPQPFSQQRIEMEMPMLSEKEIVQEDTLRLLNSVDDAIASEAANDILDSATRLRIQNTNLSRLMVWLAVQDSLTITYPSGLAVDIVYQLNNSDGHMSQSHIRTTSMSWSNPNAQIIEDVNAWNQILLTDFAETGAELRVSTMAWQGIQRNTAIQKTLRHG